MDAPPAEDEAHQATAAVDTAKSSMPPAQKMMPAPPDKVFRGREPPPNEKFRFNPPPTLTTPPRDAPVSMDRVRISPFTSTCDTLTPSSRGRSSTAFESHPDADADKELSATGLPRSRRLPWRFRDRICHLPRRTFFLVLYITAGLLVLFIVIFLAAYLTKPKGSTPCDSDYMWQPQPYISTPGRNFNYLGCYLSAAAGGVNPPVVQNASNWNSGGPNYDRPLWDVDFNNTDCALLCQDFDYFSTGQEKNNTLTCRCGNWLVGGGGQPVCRKLCNHDCAYLPGCDRNGSCIPKMDDLCGGYGFASVYQVS